MKLNIYIPLVLLLILITSNLFSNEEYSLWLKAQIIAEVNLGLVPGKTRQEMETVDDKSEEIIQNSDVIILHQLDEEGRIINILQEQKTDGEGSDHPDNDRMVESLMQKDYTPKREGLFFTEIGDKLRIKLTEERQIIDGFICREYQVNYTTAGQDDKDVIFTGSVWLDEDSGAPIYLDFEMDKTPRFIRNIHVERSFAFNPETNEWVEGELLTTVEIRFLLKRMTNTTRISYSDYWHYPAEDLE